MRTLVQGNNVFLLMQFYGKAKELCQEKLGLTTAPVTLAPPAGRCPGGDRLHHLFHPPSRGSGAPFTPSTLFRQWLTSFPVQ
jgi:hypothetical protein